jgi:citrate synthase
MVQNKTEQILSISTQSSNSSPGVQFTHTAKESLTVIDNRSGEKLEFTITDNSINCTDLARFKDQNGEVLRSYDPAYMNTVCCTSSISFIDGEKGILEYRGYPIEQLAEQASFLETAYLVIYGEIPTRTQLHEFNGKVMANSQFHPGLEPFIKAFPKHTHPMAMMTTLMAALSSFYPEANPAYVGPNIYKEKEERDKHIIRVLGCAPTIAAACYRHRLGLESIEPDKNVDYI